MILVWLILILLLGGVAAWLAGRWGAKWARAAALAATLADFAIAVGLWLKWLPFLRSATAGPWLVELKIPWIPELGVSLHLAMDGLSLLLIVLTMAIAVISVFVSWDEIHTRAGFYYFNLLWVIAGITGVFLAIDLFLFYFFWELMLIPMALLIVIWGYERRVYAALKFFLFTQLSSLLMLIAIAALYLLHHAYAGVWSFDYPDLAVTPLSDRTAMLLMLGFFAAFAVKLPIVPFHNWLPDAHTEAPTAGSVILAGLLLKTGAYGLIRFVLGIFPGAAAEFAPVALALAAVGIIYGAVMAFGQTDLKRLVAYTSVSHMGFVLLGVFSLNALALQGAVMEMLVHAFSTGALFFIVGAIMHRIHTRDIGRMGGFWALAPRMAGVALFFALASLGLPGLGNFVAEFLVLLGAFQASPAAACWSALGLVAAAVYALWIVQRVFHGPPREKHAFPDFSPREMAISIAMILVLIWLGLYPQPVLDTSRAAVAPLARPAPAPAAALANADFGLRIADSDHSNSALRIPHSAFINSVEEGRQ